MKPYQWIAALVIGTIIHITDVVLTIELLALDNQTIAFFEGNVLLAGFFTSGRHLSVAAIKALGWFFCLCLAVHPRIRYWVTPTVIWSATIGFGVIVIWNFGWHMFVRTIPH